MTTTAREMTSFLVRTSIWFAGLSVAMFVVLVLMRMPEQRRARAWLDGVDAAIGTAWDRDDVVARLRARGYVIGDEHGWPESPLHVAYRDSDSDTSAGVVELRFEVGADGEPIVTYDDVVLMDRPSVVRSVVHGLATGGVLASVVALASCAASLAFRQRRWSRRLCPQCAYPRGTSGSCPECGMRQRSPRDELMRAWRCRRHAQAGATE